MPEGTIEKSERLSYLKKKDVEKTERREGEEDRVDLVGVSDFFWVYKRRDLDVTVTLEPRHLSRFPNHLTRQTQHENRKCLGWIMTSIRKPSLNKFCVRIISVRGISSPRERRRGRTFASAPAPTPTPLLASATATIPRRSRSTSGHSASRQCHSQP